MNKECNDDFLSSHIQFRVLCNRLLAFPQGRGGFRELREAFRNRFHLSWYLSDAVVASYGQKHRGCLFTVYVGLFEKGVPIK